MIRLRTPSDVYPRDAARMHRSGAILLDVREDGEWTAGHAPGAVHHPASRLADASPWPPGTTVLVICRSGNRSGRVARLLRNAGVDARNVAGGMTAWAEQQLPVVRDDGTAGAVA